MEYKVVGIEPVLNQKQNVTHLAQHIEDVIKKCSSEGWEYIKIESINVWINGNNGCFGLGATPGRWDAKQMIVFKK